MISRLLIKLAEEEVNAHRQDEKPPPPGPVYQAPWHPRPSNADPERCIRAEVYQGLGIPAQPFPGRAGLVFNDGFWGEEMTADLMRRTAYQVHSEQMPLDVIRIPWVEPGQFRWCKNCADSLPKSKLQEAWVRAEYVHGHLDWIMTDPLGLEDVLTEHKAVNHFSWNRWAAGASPTGYLAQGGLYITGTQKDNPDLKKGLLLLKNKNTAQYFDLLFHVEHGDLVLLQTEISSDDQPINLAEDETDRWRFGNKTRVWPGFLQEIMARWKNIQDYINRRTLPRRPYSLPDGDWQCEYCRWGETCWATYEAEIKEAGAVELPGLAELLDAKVRLALDKKAHDALWESIKQKATLAVAEKVTDGRWVMERTKTKSGYRWRPYRAKEAA